MRKSICLLVAFIMCLLCACGEEKNPALENVESLTEEKTELLTVLNDKYYLSFVFEDYVLNSDIVYAKTKDEKGVEVDLALDIYQPQTDIEASPVIMLIHGGGLTSGDKANESIVKNLAEDYARMGYVVVVPNYRLGLTANQMSLENAMVDINCALKWIEENGVNYGMNIENIIVGGFSSGADIAINLCYTNKITDYNDDNIKAVIDISGSNLYYGIDSKKVKPCLIIHGTKDTTVPYSSGEKIAKSLEEKNMQETA